MTFEVKDKDLLGRTAKLFTKSGTVETPLLLPVVNPSIQSITPRKLKEVFGFGGLITNAYILKKRFQNEAAEKGIHKFLDFNGVVMTDSGAYQILIYGEIEITPKEIVEYQEDIATDIATILDHPTGWKATRSHAEKTVRKTIERGKHLFKIRTRDDILWTGPIQGGVHLDLVAKSAKEMAKLPFEIFALGSPTEIMQNYRFDVLVDMILAAKMNLPIQKPLHLFGAGHPFMFSLAVALGCDIFDSAAYALYAREDRYMTESGTQKLGELRYLPCSCPRCVGNTPERVKQMPIHERRTFLAEHNLYICQTELRRIKQAMRNGRLWEHLEMRAHGHPALLQAVKRLERYQDYFEKHSPSVKRKGLFFFGSVGLARPEIVRHREKMKLRYSPPEKAKILLLLPKTQVPTSRDERIKELMRIFEENFDQEKDNIHVCFYAAPFGVIPVELSETYPLSQHESTFPIDDETSKYVANQIADYIIGTNYEAVALLYDSKRWNRNLLNSCRRACKRRRIVFEYTKLEEHGKTIRQSLKRILKNLREQNIDSS